jgi:glycosyltransferase involved in cell wall biosynthesis
MRPLSSTSYARPNFRIVGAGRIGFQKDPSLFARIARAHKQNSTFTWIGDGELSLRRELEAAGVAVTGWVSRREMLDLMAVHDVLLHTARYEGMPLVCVEAMALGLPVLARKLHAYDGIEAIQLYDNAEEANAMLDRLRDSVDYNSVARSSLAYASGLTADAQHSALAHLYDIAAHK